MRRIVLSIVVLLATSASAGIEHTILNGVSVARVLAAMGPDALPGVTREALVALAEARLKEAGVPRSRAADADLVIAVAATMGPSGSCFVDVDARLAEEARLERNGLRVEAASWSGGSRVVVDAQSGAAAGLANRCARLTVEAVERVVGDFVEHYRAMNPKG